MQNNTIDLRWKGLICFLLIGIIYLYYSELERPSITPKWIIGSATAFIGVTLLFSRKSVLKISWPLVIWLSFIFWYVIRSFESYNIMDSLMRSTPLILAPILVYIFFTDNIRERMRWTIRALAIIIFPLLIRATLELIQLSIDGLTKEETEIMAYSFGNRNQFCQFITLTVPLLSLGILWDKKQWTRILYGGAIMLIYIVVSLMINRTSLLVLYGVYPMILVVFLLYTFLSGKLKFIGIISFFGVVFSVALIFSNPINQKFFSEGSGQVRLKLWKHSYELFESNPIVGNGSGNWKIDIVKTHIQNAPSGKVYFQRAHNDFIQVAVENGLIGLIILVLFFSISLLLIIRSANQLPAKLILIGGIVGFITIASFSFPFERLDSLFLLFLFIIPPLVEASRSIKTAKYYKLGLLFISFALFFFSLQRLSFERNFYSFKYKNDIDALREIENSRYTLDGASIPVKWYSANIDYNAGKFQVAIGKFERSLRYHPYNVHALQNMAASYYGLGKIAEAEKYYKEALQINPNFTKCIMNLAALEFNTGRPEQALKTLTRVQEEREPADYQTYSMAITNNLLEDLSYQANSSEQKWFIDSLRNNPIGSSFAFETYRSKRQEFRYVIDSLFLAHLSERSE